MDKEAADARDRCAEIQAALHLPEERCNAKHRERQHIVEQHRRRAPRISAVKDQLEQTVGKRGEEAVLPVPAIEIDEQRQHTDADASALRQFHQLDIAQRRRQCDHDRALAERVHLGFFHKNPSKNKKVPHTTGFWCRAVRSISIELSYTKQLPTPALPGSGLRDMQKRNLSRLPSAPVFDCLWPVGIIASGCGAVKKNLRTAASCFFPGNRYYSIVWLDSFSGGLSA